MIYKAAARPLPFGGSIQLELLTDPLTELLILASTDAAPPTLPLPSPTRIRQVHAGPLVHSWQPAHAFGPPATGKWFQVLDLDTANLPDDRATYYHLFEAGVHKQTLTATPSCLLRTVSVLVRDIVTPRLDYHLRRALKAGTFTVLDSGTKRPLTSLPILQVEAFGTNPQVPLVLIKERAVPDLSGDTIGKGGGADTQLPDGTWQREYRRNARVTVDVLLLCDNPQHRADIGKFLYEVLHQDLPYWEFSGLQGTSVTRIDAHTIENNFNAFTTEASLECLTQITTTERLQGRVIDNGVVARPTP